MKQFKDFIVEQSEIISEDDDILLPEGFVYDEEPLLEGAPSSGRDIPAVLVMRRTAIRMFPGGQKIALYKVDKINKYVTVPYDNQNWLMSGEKD
jgi:hypothetical protein